MVRAVEQNFGPCRADGGVAADEMDRDRAVDGGKDGPRRLGGWKNKADSQKKTQEEAMRGGPGLDPGPVEAPIWELSSTDWGTASATAACCT